MMSEKKIQTQENPPLPHPPSGFHGRMVERVPKVPKWVGQIQFWSACFVVVGWSIVISCAFAVQMMGDYPCPLCMIQRMFMILASLGAMYIIVKYLTGRIHKKDYMMGWGMMMFASIVGAFASWRQTMLHINDATKLANPSLDIHAANPNNGAVGYGSPVMGLHLYVWALILFMISLLVANVLLATSYWTDGRSHVTPVVKAIGKFAIYYLMLIIVANLVMVFFLEGFHWVLPDDPNRYELLYQLGIKK